MSTKGWFKQEIVGGIKYEWVRPSKSHYEIVGPGDRECTPKELVEALTESSKKSYFCDTFGTSGASGSIIEHHDITDLDHKRVELPAGIYKYTPQVYNDEPGYFAPMDIAKRSIVQTQAYQNLINDIQDFTSGEKIYRDAGLLHKRGYLLFGAPGEGKTTIINGVINELRSKDCIIIFMNHTPEERLVEHLNKYEPDRLKIFIMEELTCMMEHGKVTQSMLDFLDGERSVDKSMCIATTNYPKELPGNIVERPSRFDYLVQIHSPDQDEAEKLIKSFTKKDPSKREIKKITGLSTATIKEVCILSLIKQLSLLEAYDILKNRCSNVSQLFKKDDDEELIL